MATDITHTAPANTLLKPIEGTSKWSGTISYNFIETANTAELNKFNDARIPGAFSVPMTTDLPAIYETEFALSLKLLSEVANFTFVINNDINADFLVGEEREPVNLGLGYSDIPDDNPQRTMSFNDSGPSSFAHVPNAEIGGSNDRFTTIIHEIGHSIGLAHPHQGGNGTTAAPGTALDNMVYTFMSYIVPDQANINNYDYGRPAGPMALDIAALQNMYGANMTTRTGNTTYSLFDATSTALDVDGSDGTIGIGRAYFGIWDAGGSDEIRYDGSANSLLNLMTATLTNSPGTDVTDQVSALMATTAWSTLSVTTQADISNSNASAGGFFSSVLDGSGNRIAGGYSIANGAVIEKATGGSGNDILVGNAGNNILNGSAGNDTLLGGDGNDTLIDGVVNSGQGMDILMGGGGNDVIIARFAGGVATTNDTYDGGAGSDTLNVSDDTAGWTVNLSAQSYSVAGTSIAAMNFENFIGSANFANIITGSTAANVLKGGNKSDTLRGGANNDTLNGAQGADTMTGDAGNDLYFVDNAGDQIIETAGGGTGDRVATSISYTLANSANIELFSTTSSSSTAAVNLTGNRLAQTITGNAGANIIADGGGVGADVLQGLAGNDIYIVRSKNTTINENAGQGTNDRVATSFDFTLAADDHVERLTTTSTAATSGIDLAGNAFAQIITGNAGNNVLRSGTGASDTLQGLGGNDIYRVFNAGDQITENSGQGNDRVITTVNYTLGAGDSIELFTTNSSTSTAAINLTGNRLTQTINGNAGANIIADGGGVGADVLQGLAGNDIYIVRSKNTTVNEKAGQGTNDRVATSFDFTLAADDHIERLTTTSTAATSGIDLAGNAFAQIITGNAGNNVLRSGTGAADTLQGLGGNDIYRVSNAGDQIIEVGGQGTDRVITTIDYTLGSGDSIELFTTNSTAGTSNIDLTGNSGRQTITGNSGDNRINSKGGSDTVRGLAGDDTFIFDSALRSNNVDKIIDFTVADDQFELENAIFSAIGQTSGTLQGSRFKANSAGVATDANDRIIYDTDSGDLFYDADGNGAGAAQQIAELSIGLALTFNDFDIV